MNTTLLELARAVERAAEIHEDSWNALSFRYGTNIYQAALRTCPSDEATVRLVQLLLVACWNDALDWAKHTIESVEGPRS